MLFDCFRLADELCHMGTSAACIQWNLVRTLWLDPPRLPLPHTFVLREKDNVQQQQKTRKLAQHTCMHTCVHMHTQKTPAGIRIFSAFCLQ